MTEPLTLGWLVTTLLGILSVIGILAVKQFIAMNKNLNDLNTKFAVMITKHDNLEERVEKLEKHIENE